MEITVKKDPILSEFDTGGGTREVSAIITIDSTMPLRMQRHRTIYEILGACLGFAIGHSEREEITEKIMDGLDQVEAQNETTNSNSK